MADKPSLKRLSIKYITSRREKKEEERKMKFVPYGKLSKKKKRQLDLARRGGWGGMSPVTRRGENPKAYKRKKIRLSDLSGERDLFSRRLQNKVLLIGQ
jgi:hypothetical protein